MSNGENRCFCVLVDSDDDIAFLHAGQMLDSTADAAGKVDMRSNRFTGLANLLGVSQPALVNSGTSACYCGIFKESCMTAAENF